MITLVLAEPHNLVITSSCWVCETLLFLLLSFLRWSDDDDGDGGLLKTIFRYGAWKEALHAT